MAAARCKGYVGRGRQWCEGECEPNKGKRARAEEGTRARARVD